MKSLLGSLGAVWRFGGWYEGNSLITTSRGGALVMNQPHLLVAHWNIDNSKPLSMFLMIAIGFAGISLVLIVLGRRKAMSKPKAIDEWRYRTYLDRLTELRERGRIGEETFFHLKREYEERMARK